MSGKHVGKFHPIVNKTESAVPIFKVPRHLYANASRLIEITDGKIFFSNYES